MYFVHSVLLTGFLLAFAPGVSGAELGAGFTPLGSLQAGNEDGTIPPWTGGITQPPANYKRGDYHTDPFAADRPLFSITAANLAKHQSLLTATHQKLLEQNPKTYRMDVYPARRSCSLPEHVLAATAVNHKNARLENDGNNVAGAAIGVPFPVPESALEVMWNHNFHYRGVQYLAKITTGTVYPDGSFNTLVREDKRLMYYADPQKTEDYASRNIQFAWYMKWPSGGRIAGMAMSFANTIDQTIEPRIGHAYSPNNRKVRRTPPAGATYDAPMSSSNGMRLSDDLFLYNGAPDRYTWRLIGKREMVIPYNVYRATSSAATVEAFLSPRHLNPDFLRYEKHRLWVVEAVLKPQYQHKYHRRVFYIDEDSWIITAVDIYDDAGEHIRGQLGFIKNAYELPACVQDFDVMYEFSSGRYHIDNLKNGFGAADTQAPISEKDFGPAALRRAGR